MFGNNKDCLFNDKILLKSQQRFKSDCHNVYTEEINKIALSSNNDKRLQTSDTIKRYPYGANALKVCESKMLIVERFIPWKIIITINIKMINLDNYVNENKTRHNKTWPYIPDHPYIILIIAGSESGKTNVLLNLIENQPDIDKIYLYAKDPFKSKYQYLINKREGLGMNHFSDPKAIIEYSNDMHHVYKNIDEYDTDKENRMLIVFDDMISDMIHNKKLNSIVPELFIRGRKLSISLVFITQLYFKVPKDVRLISSHFFIAKVPNKRELQQVGINHSSDINTKDFANIYRKYTDEPYSFLVNDTKFASNIPLRFRKNLFNIEYNSII